MKRLILLACIVVVVFAAISAVAFLWRADRESIGKELSPVDELQRRFNEDEGSSRILLLLSPT